MDGFHQFALTIVLKSKYEVSFLLQKHFSCIENESCLKVTNVTSKNGSELKYEIYNNFLEENGITHLTTAPYTPQKNPLSEQGNGSTVAKARCLLKDSGLSGSYWGKAVRAATYLRNITPKRLLDHSTPFKKWFKRNPSYPHLQPSGCLLLP
ncbi:hypothetical protein O181_031556 [Austropuccinia psidii MF-1]|uniref:Integrase catalytic domain-containing protein n=1 Tax=Austropuccinia psidii MF-1 TaxID=1389203 RepID=A0A9Q3D0Q1_9BASI|nr:hypothetical protein [Austropuccinia psidii MF-1]